MYWQKIIHFYIDTKDVETIFKIPRHYLYRNTDIESVRNGYWISPSDFQSDLFLYYVYIKSWIYKFTYFCQAGIVLTRKLYSIAFWQKLKSKSVMICFALALLSSKIVLFFFCERNIKTFPENSIGTDGRYLAHHLRDGYFIVSNSTFPTKSHNLLWKISSHILTPVFCWDCTKGNIIWTIWNPSINFFINKCR